MQKTGPTPGLNAAEIRVLRHDEKLLGLASEVVGNRALRVWGEGGGREGGRRQ